MTNGEAAQSVPPDEERGRRRWRVVAIVAGGLILLAGGAWLASNLFYDRSFSRLVSVTETAEHDPIWLDFFVAQDCFIASIIEEGDPDLALTEGLQLLDASDLLLGHVVRSLDQFRQVSILTFHGSVLAARDAIVAHYDVWNNHLDTTIPILTTLDEEEIAVVFQLWGDVVVRDGDPIELTFNDAEAAFLDAARGGEALDEVDVLFTAADVECTRGAV